MQKELDQATDMERALKDAAAVTAQQHMMLLGQVGAGKAEMSAMLEGESKARSSQMKQVQYSICEGMTGGVNGKYLACLCV